MKQTEEQRFWIQLQMLFSQLRGIISNSNINHAVNDK